MKYVLVMLQTLFLIKHSGDTNWDIFVYYTQYKNLLFILLHEKRNIQNMLSNSCICLF